MMMTKKRKIKSTLSSEPKPQFVRAALAAALGIVVAIGLGGVAEGQVVYPTGDPAQDVPNVQAAVNSGGTVLLKATDASGSAQYFNFGDGYVEINNDVVIMGEPGYVTLPDGRTADRTAIYGGGAGTQSHEGGNPDLRGAFTVMSGSFQISGLWLDSSSFASIFVRGCNGARISDNVMTYIRPVQSVVQPWRSWAKPIVFAEWISYDIFGDIIIENNNIEFNPNPPFARWPEGISIVRVQSTPNFFVKGNTIVGVITVGSGHGKGIQSWSPATIEDNIIELPSPLLGYSRNTGILLEQGGVIRNNTITGEMLRGIQANYSFNSVIKGNTIDRVISPWWHPWWNGAIALDWSTNCTVQGNTIRGEGRSAIHLHNTDDSYILDNDCSGYTANSPQWQGDPIVGLCQMWFGKHSDDNTVSGNIWGPVPSDGVAVVLVSAYQGASNNLNILDNDYTQCSVPGWTSSTLDGPGCVLLADGTQWSLVSESGNFPPGTGGAKKQVVDLTKELIGSTTNRIVGHPANFLAEDECPGIGQRLNQILAEIDALPEEEPEELEGEPDNY